MTYPKIGTKVVITRLTDRCSIFKLNEVGYVIKGPDSQLPYPYTGRLSIGKRPDAKNHGTDYWNFELGHYKLTTPTLVIIGD